MFEFEDAGEMLKLITSWLLLSCAMPLYYKLVLNESIFLQMVSSVDGWVYFVLCFLVAVVTRPIFNKISRRNDRK